MREAEEDYLLSDMCLSGQEKFKSGGGVCYGDLDGEETITEREGNIGINGHNQQFL